MTCRVARSCQDLSPQDLVVCYECGSADLEGYDTSKALGPHLCPLCSQPMVECGTTKETRPRSQM